jgi:hypothetical protein
MVNDYHHGVSMKDLIEAALKRATEQIQYSDLRDTLSKTAIPSEIKTKVEEAKIKINELRNKIAHLSPLKQVEEIKKASAGNCEEMGILVMDFFAEHLKKYPEAKINVEMFRLKFLPGKAGPGETADHVIVVLNRKHYNDAKEEAVISNPGDWGDDYWIIDAVFNSIHTPNTINELSAVIAWYSTASSGYEREAFNPNKFGFEKHLSMEAFRNGEYAASLGCTPFESIMDWPCEPALPVKSMSVAPTLFSTSTTLEANTLALALPTNSPAP